MKKDDYVSRSQMEEMVQGMAKRIDQAVRVLVPDVAQRMTGAVMAAAALKVMVDKAGGRARLAKADCDRLRETMLDIRVDEETNEMVLELDSGLIAKPSLVMP